MKSKHINSESLPYSIARAGSTNYVSLLSNSLITMKIYKLYAKQSIVFGEQFPGNGFLLEPVAHITGTVDCMKTRPTNKLSVFVYPTIVSFS